MRFTLDRKTLLALTGVSLAFYFGCSGGGGGGGTASGSGGHGASSAGGSSGASSGGSAAGNGTGGGINLGGNGGTSSGSGGSTIAPDAGCATSTQKGTLIPANLLFVVDRSGSMSCNLPQDGQSTANCAKYPKTLDPSKPTKWALTVQALENALSQLQQGGIDVRAGLTVFPNNGTNCTVGQGPNVPIKKLDQGQVATLSTFLDNETPGGSTPLVGAVVRSYGYYVKQWKSLPGNKFVVVLTDGFESCVGEQRVDRFVDTLANGGDVSKANSIGIRTFAIGVPGSEDGRALLSDIAYLGGTGKTGCSHKIPPPLPPASGSDVGDCHFDMTTSTNFSQDLQDALKKISGTVLSCELDVPTNPNGGGVDPNKVNVTINNKIVQPDGQPDGATCNASADGWQYNSTKTKIELCGQACTDAKQANATVQVVLGCPTGSIR